ncbi:MAG: hypothetical protein ACJAT7_003814 [Psychromonas sp.]|jgi:hypothetical protein|uniref:hypothetical protein n=1 Tax=Psychromonas sp. TaxID=1884585 RepID=UPI0039E49520
MAFERIQKQTHIIADKTVFVSYDRFTTRFEIKSEKEVIYSSLVLLPIKKPKILINNQQFTLSIFWLILWKSQLVNTDGVVVKELLQRRRKKSIGLLIYFALISSVKIGIGLVA